MHRLFRKTRALRYLQAGYVLLGCLLVLAGCSKKNLYATKEAQNILIDGLATDWPQLTQYDADSKILYDVFHDYEHLYVLVESTDPAASRKIAMFGLTIWVDGKAKERKVLGVNYPLDRSGEIRQKMQERMAGGGGNGGGFPGQGFGGGANEGGMPQTPPFEPGYEMRLVGFGGVKEQVVPLADQTTGIAVAMGKGSQQGAMIYEVAIPLFLVSEALAEGTAKVGGLELSVGIETGSLNIQRPGGMGMGRMGGMRPMGGMGRMGRMGGQGGRAEQMQAMRTPTKIWVTTALAAGQ